MAAIIVTARRYVDPVGVSLWITFLLAIWLDEPWLLVAWQLGLMASDNGSTRDGS